MAWLQVWCYTVKPVAQDMLRILRSFNIFEAILGNSCGHDSLWASMANLGWFVSRLQDMLETCKIRTCLHCLQCSIWTARPERHPSHHTWCIMVRFLHLVPQLAWLARKRCDLKAVGHRAVSYSICLSAGVGRIVQIQTSKSMWLRVSLVTWTAAHQQSCRMPSIKKTWPVSKFSM